MLNPQIDMSINVSNCNECIDLMFVLWNNLSKLSLNCISKKVNNVVCQLFFNVTYMNGSEFE